MEDEDLFSFWYAYEGGIMLVLMHAVLSARDGIDWPRGPRGTRRAGLDASEIERATEPVLFTDSAECSICIAPHDRRGSVKLACGHCFHAPCIARWLARARTCPVCRRSAWPERTEGPEGTEGTERTQGTEATERTERTERPERTADGLDHLGPLDPSP